MGVVRNSGKWLVVGKRERRREGGRSEMCVKFGVSAVTCCVCKLG